MNKKITLAIFSPNQGAYSETFIEAHKSLPFPIKFYYGGWLPGQLEGRESMLNFSLFERIEKKIKHRFGLYEYGLYYSLKRERVNCVLGEYGPTACETLDVVKALQLPLIVHFHGFDASVFEFINKYKASYKEVFAYAKAVIVVSKKMYNDLKILGCPVSKLHLIPCGANPDFFNIQPSFGNRHFIAVGRFVDKKAPYLTIAAFKKVLDVYPDAKLIMCGDGELLNTCINLTRSWKIQSSVEFKGKVSHQEVMHYFSTSLAFVQHSVTDLTGDSEGTPVAVMEAMAAGIPVVATNHAGIPDIVRHNETGLLCEETDIDGMAKNMALLIQDNTLAKMLGSNAKNYAMKNLSLTDNLKKISNIILDNSDKILN